MPPDATGTPPVRIVPSIEEEHRLRIDGNRSTTMQIKAERFLWCNGWIDDVSFPVKRPGERTTRVVSAHLGIWATPEEVWNFAHERGLVPGFPEHLLAYTRARPDQQRKHPIVATGTTWRYPEGKWPVALCLGTYYRERSLGLIAAEAQHKFMPWCRFILIEPGG